MEKLRKLADGVRAASWADDGLADPLASATGSGTIRVINRSTLTGTTTLGSDQDVYDGSSGFHEGQVYAGAENDMLFGGQGTDRLFGEDGNDVIAGGAGDDFIDGGSGSDSLDGGAGIDTVSYVTSTSAVTLDLGSGIAVSAGRDVIANFERVIGSAFNDTLIGGAGDDTLEGRDGDDALSGAGGSDVLIGGRGDDTLTGGGGRDHFLFTVGDGQDTVSDFQIGIDRLVIHGRQTHLELRQVGADTLVVLEGGDTILLRGVTAASLTPDSFDYRTSAPDTPADPPSPSASTSLRRFSDVIIHEDEVRAFEGGWSWQQGYTLVEDSARWTIDRGGHYAPSFMNAGTLTLAGADSALAVRSGAGANSDRAWIYNLETGVISVTVASGGTAGGYEASYTHGSNVYNAGDMLISSDGWATAVSLYQVGQISVVNTGLISVAANFASGLELNGQISFWNSGEITVAGVGNAVAMRVENSVQVVVNSGTITATASGGSAVGLYVPEGVGLTHIYNDGVIEAATALNTRGQPAPAHRVNDNDHIYNTGELRGEVLLGHERDELYNSGLITGPTWLGGGDDVYDGRGGNQLGGVHGEAGADILIGGSGVDQLDGGEGDDLLAGRGGNDVLTGGMGKDVFHVSAGDGRDVIKDFDAVGGEIIRLEGYSAYLALEQIGADVRVVLSASESILLEGVRLQDLTAANFQFNAVALANAEQPPERPVAPSAPDFLGGPARPLPIQGQGGADDLAGTIGDDVIHGGDGDDRISAGQGSDDLFGGGGADIFVYAFGDGQDVVHDFSTAQGDVIRLDGVTGEDVGGFVVQGFGHDTILTFRDGGTLRITNATPTEVRAALQLGSPPGYRVQEGGGADDDLNGSDVADLLRGGNGADRLRGFAGDDLLEGGQGNDVLEGGRGEDRLTGGSGADVFIFRPGDGADVITDFNAAEGDVLFLEGCAQFNHTFIHFNDIIIQAGNERVTLIGVNDLADVVGSIRVGPPEPTAPAITGTGAGDRLTGTAQGERITGGAGGDILIGGGGSDVIEGNAGDDTISGDAGLDRLTGGSGADTFLFRPGDHNDIITDFNGAEGDVIRLEGFRDFSMHPVGGGVMISATHVQTGEDITIFVQGASYDDRASLRSYVVVLPDEVPLPNIEFDRLGTTGNDTLIGDGRNEMILGGAGNDRVEGRGGHDLVEGGDGDDTVLGGDGDDFLNGGAGSDVMTGGAGRDWFAMLAGDGRDTVTDFNPAEDVIDVGFQPILSIAQRGADTIISLHGGDQLVLSGVLAHELGARHFVRTLTTPPLVPAPAVAVHRDGTNGADILNGSDYDDELRGLGGDDRLYGGDGDDVLDGGQGVDHLHGGAGDDAYHVDQQGDLVFEAADGGHDTVTASAGFYLYDNVEDLILAQGAGDIFGVGNALANVIRGNDGSNLLIAGAGDDTVFGGAGVDSLFGQDGDDVLNGQAGIDYLVGGAGDDTLDGGTEADALYGEDGDDILIGGHGFVTDILVGGTGNDTLRGDSGLGDYDRMDGGSGDDIYWVDTGDDLTFEAAGGGRDVVYADVRVANGGVYLYAHVEDLVLVGTTAFGVGNELDNRLTGSATGNWLLGGAGNDVLNGKGANDVLFGEGGRDTFVFEVGTGGDVIGDFSIADDFIDLTAFSNLGNFATLQGRFVQNGADGAIDLGNGDFVVLNGVTMANLTAANFVFDQGSAPASPTVTAIKDAGPLVLPGLIGGLDDDFLPGLAGKGHDMPLVLPGLSDEAFAKDAGPLVLPAMAGDFDLSSGLAARDVFVFADAAPSLDGPRLGLEADHILHAHAQDPWAL